MIPRPGLLAWWSWGGIVTLCVVCEWVAFEELWEGMGRTSPRPLPRDGVLFLLPHTLSCVLDYCPSSPPKAAAHLSATPGVREGISSGWLILGPALL